MGINLTRSNPVFIVEYIKHKDMWYFVELEDDTNTAIWTANIDKAHTFTSREGITDFCEVYLSDRPYSVVEVK